MSADQYDPGVMLRLAHEVAARRAWEGERYYNAVLHAWIDGRVSAELMYKARMEYQERVGACRLVAEAIKAREGLRGQ